MPRWLPATEPETIKLVWLAAVNVQVSLVVSKPFAVTTTVPSPLLEPEVTAPTEATVPVFSVSLVTQYRDRLRRPSIAVPICIRDLQL